MSFFMRFTSSCKTFLSCRKKSQDKYWVCQKDSDSYCENVALCLFVLHWPQIDRSLLVNRTPHRLFNGSQSRAFSSTKTTSSLPPPVALSLHRKRLLWSRTSPNLQPKSSFANSWGYSTYIRDSFQAMPSFYDCWAPCSLPYVPERTRESTGHVRKPWPLYLPQPSLTWSAYQHSGRCLRHYHQSHPPTTAG